MIKDAITGHRACPWASRDDPHLGIIRRAFPHIELDALDAVETIRIICSTYEIKFRPDKAIATFSDPGAVAAILTKGRKLNPVRTRRVARSYWETLGCLHFHTIREEIILLPEFLAATPPSAAPSMLSGILSEMKSSDAQLLGKPVDLALFRGFTSGSSQ